jgi:hypothetical protein
MRSQLVIHGLLEFTKTVAQFVPAGESTGGHQSLGQGMLFEKSYVGELMGAGVTAISLFGNKISTN